MNLGWLAGLRPDISAENRALAVREAFDWLMADQRGQIVIGTVLEEYGFLDPIRTNDPMEIARAVEARNCALAFLGHLGTDSVRRVLVALTRKE